MDIKIYLPVTIYHTTGGKAMLRSKQILVGMAVLCVLLTACGGGGSSSPTSTPNPTPTPTPTPTPMTLEWSPPQYFTDNDPLVPVRDLECLEIYVRKDIYFGLDDTPIETLPPEASTFDLANLAPSLSKGVSYYASVRAVSIQGEKSDFSPSASFSFPE